LGDGITWNDVIENKKKKKTVAGEWIGRMRVVYLSPLIPPAHPSGKTAYVRSVSISLEYQCL